MQAGNKFVGERKFDCLPLKLPLSSSTRVVCRLQLGFSLGKVPYGVGGASWPRLELAWCCVEQWGIFVQVELSVGLIDWVMGWSIGFAVGIGLSV